jgi:Leucine-rich repeat (LRR) protein
MNMNINPMIIYGLIVIIVILWIKVFWELGKIRRERKVIEKNRKMRDRSGDVDDIDLATIFPDAAFAKIVAKQLDIPVTEKIPNERLLEIKTLDASKQKISNLTGISKLVNLQSVDLSSNELNSFSDELNTLVQLSDINLAHNKLTNVDTIKSSSITKLNLAGNKIATISDQIFSLANLTELNVSDCDVTNIPNSLNKATSLKNIDLSKNTIDQSPEIAELLKNIEQVKIDSPEVAPKIEKDDEKLVVEQPEKVAEKLVGIGEQEKEIELATPTETKIEEPSQKLEEKEPDKLVVEDKEDTAVESMSEEKGEIDLPNTESEGERDIKNMALIDLTGSNENLLSEIAAFDNVIEKRNSTEIDLFDLDADIVYSNTAEPNLDSVIEVIELERQSAFDLEINESLVTEVQDNTDKPTLIEELPEIETTAVSKNNSNLKKMIQISAGVVSISAFAAIAVLNYLKGKRD